MPFASRRELLIEVACVCTNHIWLYSFALTDVLAALNHRLDAKWRHFGTFLGVEYQTMEAIRTANGGNPEDCMLDLLGKWASNQAGTGTLLRTWQTVTEAVQQCGDEILAQDLAAKHGRPRHLSQKLSPSL